MKRKYRVVGSIALCTVVAVCLYSYNTISLQDNFDGHVKKYKVSAVYNSGNDRFMAIAGIIGCAGEKVYQKTMFQKDLKVIGEVFVIDTLSDQQETMIKLGAGI